ncbi:hemolysin family protein [Paenibacillus sp. CC-CFT747]|nr:hemolysin family protein [Paenibacillus sp. CC-CFT747]
METEFELGKITWNLLIVLVLVALNGIFVAAEFAFVKIRQTRLQELANEGKNVKYAMTITRRLDTYLSATQLGITLASLGLGWVGEPTISELVMDPLLERLNVHNDTLSSVLSFLAAFLTITFFHIVFGEQAPKTLAIRKAEGTAMLLSGPMILFNKIFRPLIWVLNAASVGVLKLIGIEPGGEHEAHTEEEIRILMNQSAKSGHIDRDELVLFDNIFEFSDRLAREIMLPRTDIDCLFTDATMDENLLIVHNTRHTRYPVAVEDKDQIIGFVHITDILTGGEEPPKELRKLVRPILTVPESMEISHVLRLMQKRKSQLAIVVDEYGGTAGLLTAEDILEEIVGEIQDEFDNERPEYEVKENIVSVDGRMLIEDVSDLLALDLHDEEVDSIGGWLFKKLEGVPAKGKKFVFGGHTFEVAEAERLRIVRVNIYKPEKPSTPPAGAVPTS